MNSAITKKMDALAPLQGLELNSDDDAVNLALLQFREQCTNIDGIQLTLVRERAVSHLRTIGFSSPAKVVDAALKSLPPEPEIDICDAQFQKDIVPWPKQVNGRELAKVIIELLGRHVVMPHHCLVAVTLWTIFSHVINSFAIAPILLFSSPQKRCGKTTALNAVAELMPRVLFTVNITAAGIFRSVHEYRCSLVIDEGDTFVNGSEGLRGILNSSHNRRSAQVADFGAT